MSAIEAREAKARAFFMQFLVPAAERLSRAGRSFLPRRPDASAATYYTVRDKRAMNRADFEVRAAERPEDVALALTALWAGDPDLSALVAPLARLMPDLVPAEGEKGDVSPFVYVMF
jgi:hypothetical protein